MNFITKIYYLGSVQNSVLITPRNATVGRSSVLTCEVQTSLSVNTSLLSVQWRHSGRVVTTNNTGGFVLTQGTGGVSVYVTELRFNQIGVEHSGLYSCRVSLDTDRWQVTTEGNLTVTCEIIINQNHMLLTCFLSHGGNVLLPGLGGGRGTKHMYKFIIRLVNYINHSVAM